MHTKLISQTLSFVLMGYFCTSVAIGGVAKFSLCLFPGKIDINSFLPSLQ